MFAKRPFQALLLLGFGPADKLVGVHPQLGRDPLKGAKCQVLFASLNSADVVRFNAEQLSEPCLRQVSRFAKP